MFFVHKSLPRLKSRGRPRLVSSEAQGPPSTSLVDGRLDVFVVVGLRSPFFVFVFFSDHVDG